jgi:hypothetical protein
MFIEDKDHIISIQTEKYKFSISRDNGSIRITAGADKYIDFPAIPSQPCLENQGNCYPEIKSILQEKNSAKISIELHVADTDLENITCNIGFTRDAVSFQTSYLAVKKHKLAGWQIFQKETTHNYSSLDNLWNRPEESSNIWSYDTLHEVTTTTGGANRIWAPHVPAIILRSQTKAVLLGVPELTHAFALNYRSTPSKNSVKASAVLDYGIDGYRFEVNARESVTSPLIMLKFFENFSSEDIYADYYRNYRLSQNSLKESQLGKHWFQPWYCTWSDQYSISMSNDNGHQGCLEVLDEQFVLKALAKIKNEKLPIGTFIIDDGWQTLRGDWNINQTKFPDMRRLTDTLHEAGMKVILWWAPFCYDEQAEITQKEWMFCEGVDAYGNRMLDYSSTRVQEEYLNPLLNKIFSVWNFDGVKIDFLADRNHSTAKAMDHQWHGQEYYLLNLYRLIYESASSQKDDFCIYGTAQHPEFEPYQSVIGLEENYVPDDIYIESRSALQSKLMPSTPVTAHFNYFCSSMKEFVKQCREAGAIVQIPPIFQDLSGYRPDEEYFNSLRKLLQ